MEHNFMKRICGKAKSIVKAKKNGGVFIVSSNWMKERSYDFLEQAKRELQVDVDTNAEQLIAYPNLSRAIEYAVNSIMQGENYKWNRMLVIKNPYQYSPLCALAVFTTKNPYAVKVTVRGKTSDCDISYRISEATNHRIPIMGLYAGYDNIVDIELLGKGGEVVKCKTFKLHTDPLKGRNSLIKINKDVSNGDYLYDLTLVYGGGDDFIYPYAFDKNGDIRFCFSMAPKTYGFQPIADGKFLFLNKRATRLTFTNPSSVQLFEVDQMGRFYRSYNVEKGTHHDFRELKNGNFVVGSNAIEGGTYEDSVIEIDRRTGAILNEIKIKDYIDTKYVDSSDWAHLNSIDYNEEEKTVTVCLRNLHSIIKINYEKKELVWILANPVFWENTTVSEKVLIPEDKDMKWFFQAHAAYFIDLEVDSESNVKYIMIYDNHTDKRRPVSYYDNDVRSFVRIYRINEGENRVSLVKSFPCEQSTIRSNGIYDQAFGRVIAMNGKHKGEIKGKKSSITEFDYDKGLVLNQYTINYGFYRAYGFEFEAQKMSENMDMERNYSLGAFYKMTSCNSIDVSEAKILPAPVLEPEDKTEEQRKKRLEKLVTKNPKYYVDPEQDMTRVVIEVEEDILYVSLIDHLLEAIYFVGEKHTYCRNYTDTKQERPEYFARAQHRDVLPLSNLQEDTYEIYFKHSVGLYKTKYKIQIKRT